MSVINANPLMLGDAGYNIQRSLRFRSSASAYLSRTFGTPTNQAIWTWSGWVKRGTLGTAVTLISTGTGSSDTTRFECDWSANNTFRMMGGTTIFRESNRVFRDPSAFGHLVITIDTTQGTASLRARAWWNNEEITWATNNTLTTCGYNTAAASRIGKTVSDVLPFDGYLAEVNFIDGQALTPSSFGQTDAVTGVWQPKKYTGTYGTNGFYLPFTDNSSPTTLGYDKSGNGNNWTPNNISTTAGATYDSMTDVPTLTSATAANYCVINPLSLTSPTTLANGNLQVSTGTTGGGGAWGSFAYPLSGKFYYEFVATGIASANCRVGISDSIRTYSIEYNNDGTKTVNGSVTSYGATYTDGDVIGVACDIDSGTVIFYKNNASQGSISNTVWLTIPQFAFCADGSGAAGITAQFNFGQRPFSYTPPTGFKALNTFNLPDPTIKKPNQYMDATTYTGNNTTNNVVNSGAFQPDFAWIKCRSTGSTNHMLLDSVRPNGYSLNSNTTNSEGNFNGPWTGFNSNGFGLGADGTGAANANGATYVGWQWKKGATPGFDIVTSTLPTTGINTLSHSLGVAPKMIIAKRRDGAEAWLVYQSSGTTQSQYLRLNTTDAVAASANLWGSSPISSSQFYFNGTAGWQYVFYLFAEILGFSKFGSYTGNGSATSGSFVYTGFRPKYVMIKRTDTTGEWNILDASRNTYNVMGQLLWSDSSAAEATYNTCDFLSNGFKLYSTASDTNASNGSYVYAAFAENPFKYSLAR